MSNHKIRAREVINAGGTFRVVHGICQISQKCHGFALLNHLPYREGASKDTHVEVNAAKEHVCDFVLREEIPRFLSVIRECITGGDAHARVLSFPCFSDEAFCVGAGASHVRVVDGENAFAGGVCPAPLCAPAFGGGEGRGCGREGGLLRELAGLGSLIETGHTTWGVYDQNAPFARRVESSIYGVDKLSNARRGGFAPVVVPHVTDNDCRMLWVPDSRFYFPRYGSGTRCLLRSQL